MESGSVAGKRVFIAENATVIGDVTLADDVSVWFGAVIRGDRDRISVGAGSNIQDNAVVHTTIGFPVTVGADVSVGHGAILHGCTIHDRVLVGMGAVVLNGAVVGEGSIIGAGAVVTEGKEIPPNSLVLGVPGKVVRETTPEQQESIIQNAREYVKLAERYRHD
ncbi:MULTISPECIES: gamma carbonic anhydrase family protein [Methanoculleus]|jgi:carbonic anhydrase/acetyltransferase-like protein (isoleucine patch superfamily)|uniref:Carbonic anhydrase or acetyltransferase, isoleucine patch superfamily n=1 Tax=Methanoculleus thermophilus TaxID=2200 RepID=A0A1G9ANR8_9EURY|nr:MULTISPECIES: gamma carbonic anhydrase family protein [Methanoculleus]NLN09055.1 gamma carbonic anhydrase family protein [Methanoculleus thermophilus]SDK28195.1 Carbonic anhydrase or acetyltransferase, isoleucine patch superfamily [Methanoculleus thermophilus]HQD26646.1 gamma carbonic anhydrase family protein [Methanoculleus thermophilus]